jgi:tetratricopeptide (TPR) repeat protein
MENISPQQMQNNLSMMNPEMNKNASNMISGMSDSQIEEYLSQMGMQGVNPSKFRSMCQNMSNMNDSQFNSKKNMTQVNIQNNDFIYNNNKSRIVQFITNMKEEGNKLFRSGKYKKAIEKYYETIKKIKAANDKEKYKPELDNIERICRLNIANCRLKTGDYDGVIDECSIVLESSKCFKGYYRMGLALMKKSKYDKAYRYLDNANEIGITSEKKAVQPYLKECKEKIEETKKKQREERFKKENEEN